MPSGSRFFFQSCIVASRPGRPFVARKEPCRPSRTVQQCSSGPPVSSTRDPGLASLASRLASPGAEDNREKK